MRLLPLSLSLSLILLLLAATTFASDGVLEINRACVNTGCFPGDAPGPPVEITQTGSYRLTGNLLSPNGVTGISITADAVTLDLGGFTIGPCTNVAALCPILSVQPGISGPGANQVTVKNGVIEEFRAQGVLLGADARVHDVTVRDVQGNGFQLGPGSLVEDCVASGGGSTGFSVSSGSTLEGNTARNNAAAGFSIGEGAVVRGNSALSNDSDGFFVSTGGVVVNNTADTNGGAGFRLSGNTFGRAGGLAQGNSAVENEGFGFDNGGSPGLFVIRSWGLIDNVANGNNSLGDQIQGGIELGQNVCSQSLNCP